MTQDLLIALFHVMFFHGARLHSKRLCQPPKMTSMYVTAAATAWHLFVSAIRRKKNAKANGYAVQVCWSLKNVEVKKHSFGNGLYPIPSIYGDLGDCFFIVNKRSCHNRPLKLLPPPA